MADYPNIDLLNFGEPEKENSIIKVIGVGGGGGNAVNHMYREGIHDVTFVLCNTDNQALNDSPVPVHLQLGKEGLGAGNKPERARAAAEESLEDIKSMLNDGTRMAFITAGMGGGTGTGAAPVIARVSKEMGILTVGIVTIPFRFEGDRKIDQALDGVEEMSKHVASSSPTSATPARPPPRPGGNPDPAACRRSPASLPAATKPYSYAPSWSGKPQAACSSACGTGRKPSRCPQTSAPPHLAAASTACCCAPAVAWQQTAHACAATAARSLPTA